MLSRYVRFYVMFSFSEPRVYKLYSRNKLFNDYKCGIMHWLFDDVRSREIHILSVYNDK